LEYVLFTNNFYFPSDKRLSMRADKMLSAIKIKTTINLKRCFKEDR
jgi:hypothetical protein